MASAIGSPRNEIAPDAVQLLIDNPELRQELDQYDFNVTFTGGDVLDPTDAYRRVRAFDGFDKPVHLYFHMPLCSYICHYCSFVKRLIPRGKEKEALVQWAKVLVDESTRYLTEFDWVSTARVESIYLGGGTFALLLDVPEAIDLIIGHIRRRYRLADDCEITLEGNPENYTERNVRLALELGANRFSVGAQSLQDEVNKFAKRGHSTDSTFRAINELSKTGRPFNVDMIYGQPRQAPDSFAADIHTLTSLAVPTITTYRLRNRDRIPLATGNTAVWQQPSVRERLERNRAFPDLRSIYRMRTRAVQIFLDNEYRPSPACWWSSPNHYPYGMPRVSLNKWANYDTMIGYGPGTYSWFTGGSADIIQLHNIGDISQYSRHVREQSTLPLAFGRHIKGNQAISTALGFNFKAFRPMSRSRYLDQFGVDITGQEPYASVLETLINKGFLEKSRSGQEIAPTLAGEMLHEEIMSVYFHGKLGSSRET